MTLPRLSDIGWWLVSTVLGRPSLGSNVQAPRMVFQRFTVPLGTMNVMTVDDCEGCRLGIKEMNRHMERTGAKCVGMDAEWNPGDNSPVALLQLAAPDGFCLLIRLHRMRRIPKELEEFLRDKTRLKVGVEVLNDANKLRSHYDLDVKGCLDLKYLADMDHLKRQLNKPTPSLEDLAHYANVLFEKDKDQTCSDWESEHLDSNQQMYAAQDALVGALIFMNLFGKASPWDTYIDKKYRKKLTKKGTSKPPSDVSDQMQCDQTACHMCGGSNGSKKAKLIPVVYEKVLPVCLRNLDTSLQLCRSCQNVSHLQQQRVIQGNLSTEPVNDASNCKRLKHADAVKVYEDVGLIMLVRKHIKQLFTTVQEKRAAKQMESLPVNWCETLEQECRSKIENDIQNDRNLEPGDKVRLTRQIFGPQSCVETVELPVFPTERGR